MATRDSRTFYAAEDIAANRFVKLNSSLVSGITSVVYTNYLDMPLGVSANNASAGEGVTVELWGEGRSFDVEAEGSNVAQLSFSGVPTYSGKLTTDLRSGVAPICVTLNAASGSGAIIEVLPTHLRTVNY